MHEGVMVQNVVGCNTHNGNKKMTIRARFHHHCGACMTMSSLAVTFAMACSGVIPLMHIPEPIMLKHHPYSSTLGQKIFRKSCRADGSEEFDDDVGPGEKDVLFLLFSCL